MTPIKSFYLNVNWAEYTFPSFKVTVINLQVPAHDFDVCQLKINCVPSNRNRVEPGLDNSSIMSIGAPVEQAILTDCNPLGASEPRSPIRLPAASFNCHLTGIVCPAFEELTTGRLSIG